eukprot:scaffold459011_cov118-Attheya_sp.AAC.1
MQCYDLRPFLATKKAALKEHLQLWGENAAYPVESLQTVYDHLENIDVPMELIIGNSRPKSDEASPTFQAHIARFKDLPECEVCFRRGHHAGICVIRGPNFVPPDILRRAAQYNAKHGDTPLEPLKSWTKNAPPSARYENKSKPAYKPPQKSPSI